MCDTESPSSAGQCGEGVVIAVKAKVFPHLYALCFSKLMVFRGVAPLSTIHQTVILISAYIRTSYYVKKHMKNTSFSLCFKSFCVLIDKNSMLVSKNYTLT